MNREITGRFIAGFTAAIILVLVVGLVSYLTLRNQAEQEVWVEHTYKVIRATNNVEQLLIDMETGRRGFRCTGDKKFLESYYNSQPKLAGAINNLKQLTIDNAEQTTKVESLEREINEVDAFWKSINIDLVYYNDSMKKSVTGSEKILVDSVRDDIASIVARENTLLQSRESKTSNAVGKAIWTLGIGIALILFLVFALIALIMAEFRNRVKAEDALNDKLAELEKINTETQEKNWMLGGIREINASLIGNDSLHSLINSCLAKMSDYIGVPASAFYFYDNDKKELKLAGSLAMPRGTMDVIKINEGITGRAATRHGITVIRDIPADYWKIASAIGAAVPDTVICVPLWQKKELKGVIELACLSTAAHKTTDLLNAVADNIAIAVAAAYANEVMQNLLKQVQDQKEELESQQEELRQTNEELTHQAEVLRASEEELKTQEEELRQINVEMEEKTEAVELARKALAVKAVELEASSKYKSEFLANMSHELRTPLNSLLILANLFKENKTGNLTTKQIDYARIILKSGSDLLSLINDILDLSKIEAGKVDMFPEDVPVTEIVTDMEQLFSVMANEKKINFYIENKLSPGDSINTDKQRIEQVIKNLLSNAFKFTPAAGSVTLQFIRHQASLIISVTDTGIGISPEKQQLIFEAFQQADGSTSRKFGGTGLGLSISKELIKRLGGEIKLSSKAGEGSTFSLVLPFTFPALDSTDSKVDTELPMSSFNLANVAQQTVISDNKAEVKAGEQSILIIEDDIVFAGIVNDFAHSKGYKTIIAVSGDEGLLYAQQYKPAAIILDLGLPVIDGKSILKILKADDELKNIPVHVITGEDRGDIPAAYVESYFRKPLQTRDLEAAFSNIEAHIKDHYKNILILSPGSNTVTTAFEKLISEKNAGISSDVATDLEGAQALLRQKEYECVIVNIYDDILNGIKTLTTVKSLVSTGTYVIAFLDRDISTTDEMQIRKSADSIVRKSVQATSRLMDEVELFLHKIRNTKKPEIPEGFEPKEFDQSLTGKKVLLADDDMRNVFALTALLEEQGMEVTAAENGKEALELLAKHPDVNIILMDIMMPEMDGYETMQLIRAKERYKKMPIIALTAKAMAGDREKCLEAGASDYITKPIDSAKLFSLMRVWMSR
jgi:signal transduction histidine kinase/DNA-binding response OmpR family regulator/CHASE3 domain sensor protein